MDNPLIDIYGILELSIGYGGHEHHDAVAERIALERREWMELVGRRVDMKIYVWRVLLEWAHICDETVRR